MEYNDYLRRRDELQKIRNDSFVSFDKSILALATGGLALSITFLDKIGLPFDRLTFWLIILTWICLFVVILANLISFLFAKSNMDRKIKELDDKYRIEGWLPSSDEEKEFWQKKATSVCNFIAFFAFLLGIIIFTFYIILIQKNNYSQLIGFQGKGESVMAIKKTAGITEVKKPLPKKEFEFGITETSAALSPRNVTETILPDKTIVEGKTESPKAVQPSKPVRDSKEEKKK